MDLFSQIDTTEREEILTLRKELEEANHQYYVLNFSGLYISSFA